MVVVVKVVMVVVVGIIAVHDGGDLVSGGGCWGVAGVK